MKKYEELINVIQSQKVPWKAHTVRSLASKTGYSTDASRQALLELKESLSKQEKSIVQGKKSSPEEDNFDLEIVADLSNETIARLLVKALNDNPESEKLIRCAIDFRVKLEGDIDLKDEIDMERLFELGVIKK